MNLREGNYEAKTATTWLVLLVESAFHVLFETKHYGLRTYCVSYLALQSEVKLAERAFTRCTESQLRYGGFCVTAPGSCSSADMSGLKSEDRVREWAGLLAWREEFMMPHIIANTAMETRNLNAPKYVSPRNRAKAAAQSRRQETANSAMNKVALEEEARMMAKLKTQLDDLDELGISIAELGISGDDLAV